jgi:hypothetical protein
MTRTLLTCLAIAAALAAGPVKADSPASVDECFRAAYEMADWAEEKKLSDDEIDRVDDLLFQMEEHCDASRYEDAMAVADRVRSLIETQTEARP